jgi:hypothetical protein
MSSFVDIEHIFVNLSLKITFYISSKDVWCERDSTS